MIDDKEINCDYTEEIVCPYCGHEFGLSYEFFSVDDDDAGLIDCLECDKSFYAFRNIEVTYSTYKAIYGTCSICGVEDTVVEDINVSGTKSLNVCLNCHKAEEERLIKEYSKMLYEKWDNSSTYRDFNEMKETVENLIKKAE